MFAANAISARHEHHTFRAAPPLAKTWPDVADDFVAEAAGHRDPVGRIFRAVGNDDARRWSWSLTAFGPGIYRPAVSSGGAATPQDAARNVEDAWFTATRATPA